MRKRSNEIDSREHSILLMLLRHNKDKEFCERWVNMLSNRNKDIGKAICGIINLEDLNNTDKEVVKYFYRWKDLVEKRIWASKSRNR